LIGLIRSYDAVVFGIPFVIQFLRVARRRHYVFAPFIIAGGVPFLAILLLSQLAITGSALTPVTTWGYPNFKVGLFPSDEHGHQTGPLIQLMFALYNMFDLMRWTSSILVIGYLVALIWKVRARRLCPLDLVFPWVVVAYLLYVGLGGNRYGPRMYLIGYPFLVLTLVSVLTPVFEDKTEPRRIVGASILLAGHFVTALTAAISIRAKPRRPTVYWRP
jgi:hypothetical protein